MYSITATQIININEAAKSLKQKDFVVYNDNILVGIDNIQVYLRILNNAPGKSVDSIFSTGLNRMTPCTLPMLQFNTRELNVFANSPMLGMEYELNEYNNLAYGTLSNSIGDELHYSLNNVIKDTILTKFMYAEKIINNAPVIFSGEIPDLAEQLKNMHKADGAIITNIGGYMITLFPSMLPLLKADKLFMTMYDDSPETICCDFIIKKKKCNIECIVSYLKLR